MLLCESDCWMWMSRAVGLEGMPSRREDQYCLQQRALRVSVADRAGLMAKVQASSIPLVRAQMLRAGR